MFVIIEMSRFSRSLLKIAFNSRNRIKIYEPEWLKKKTFYKLHLRFFASIGYIDHCLQEGRYFSFTREVNN